MDLEDLLTTCAFLAYGFLFALLGMQALFSSWQPGFLAAGLAAGYLLRLAYGREAK